jgi:adenosylcobyric acid synthase
MGRPIATLTATEYHARKPELLPTVLAALADLRQRFDVVVCEGAGSPAEINLLDHDIVNLRIADEAGLDAVVVGDIDLGGVFASLYGTVALLPDALRRRVRGFVINKLRGDPALLLDGCARLSELTGVPTLGVLPWLPGPGIDAEDSLALRDREPEPAAGDVLDVAVVRFPRISNFTDLEPLRAEPSVRLRFVSDAASLGRPDLVVLPGSKATVADLRWLREQGLDRALAASDAVLLGICGGYQMLGQRIDDRVESGAGTVAGLGLLPVATTFEAEKVTQNCTGLALDRPVTGYRIHHGRVEVQGGDAFVVVDGAVDGVRVDRVLGTTLHGLLEADALRADLLAEVAARHGKHFEPAAVPFAAQRAARVDSLADAIAEHLDLEALGRIVNAAAPVRR